MSTPIIPLQPAAASLVAPVLSVNGLIGDVVITPNSLGIDDNSDGVVNYAEAVPITCVNKTGAPLTKGMAVYISGAQGLKPTMAAALATAEGTSAKTVGILMADTANNAEGQVTALGLTRGIDTSAFIDGDVLYLSSTVAGGLQNSAPLSPNHMVFVAYVVSAHATQGVLLVNVQNGNELGELHDVLITAVADKNAIEYDSASGLWKNVGQKAPVNNAVMTGTTQIAALTVSGISNLNGGIEQASSLPYILLKETDQGADLKGWVTRINASKYQLVTVNDAGVGILTVADVTRAGLWTVPSIATTNLTATGTISLANPTLTGTTQVAALTASGLATLNGGASLAAGTVAAPSLYFSTDTGTGWYRIGANNNGYSVSGTKLLDLSASTFVVSGYGTFAASAVSGGAGLIVSKDTDAYSAGVSGGTVFLQGLNSSSVNSNLVKLKAQALAADSAQFAVYTGVGANTLIATFSPALLAVTGKIFAGGQTTHGFIDVNGTECESGLFIANHVTGTGSGTYYAGFGYAGAAIGSITQNGTTAVAYNTTSDHRLKNNVRQADAARFMDIEFVDFEWSDGRHDCGVIAHQLQSVYPDLVTGAKDATEVRNVEVSKAVEEVRDESGAIVVLASPAVTEERTFPVYQQVNYMGLIGRIGARLQSSIRENETLKAQLAAIEARLTAAGL